MADTKGGLSYFDDGGSAEASNAPLPVTETITVGGTKIPLKTAINSDITKNLQEEVDRRSGGFWNPVLRGFERNAAFTSDNPAMSLAAINAQHRAEDESIFNMRNNIASIKAAQQQAAARTAEWNAMNPQAGDMGQMSGAGAGAGAGSFISQEQKDIEKSLQTVDEKIASRNKYLAGINAANARAQADAAGNTQQLYRDSKTGAEIGYFTPNQVKANPSLIGNAVPSTKTATNFTPTGNASFDDALKFLFGVEGGYKDKDGNTGAPVNMGINQKYHPNVDVKNLTPDQARDIYKKEYWDAIGGDNLNPTTAKIAMDAAANQGVDYAKRLIAETGGDPEKMMAHRMSRYAGTVASDKTGQQAQNLKGWMNRLDLLRNELGQTKTNVQAAATSTTNPNLSPIEQHRIDVKEAEATVAASQKGAETFASKAGETLAKLENEQDSLNRNILNSEKVKEIALDPKRNHVMGYFHGGNKAGTMLATVLPDSLVDKKLAPLRFKGQELTDYQTLDSIGTQMGMQFTQDNVANSRLGIGMEKLGIQGKGVSAHNTPEMNLLFANINQDISQFKMDKYNAYKEWAKTNNLAFENPLNYTKYLGTDNYKVLEKAARDKLIESYKGIIKPIHTDDDARDWLAKHPNDPNAPAVRKKLGIQ